MTTQYIVKTRKAGLYLRERPSKTGRVIRLIPNGERVTVKTAADIPTGWFALDGGGYVMAEFLETVYEPTPRTEPSVDDAGEDPVTEPRRRGRRPRTDNE